MADPTGVPESVAQHDDGAGPSSASFTSGTMAIFTHWDSLVLSLRLTSSAMAIIWLGANSSLRRPPSAAPPRRTASGKEAEAEGEDKFADGLTASDAVMFPLLAGVVLAGLYYLIRWLQDPSLLNRILRAYMSVMSTASLAQLAASILHLLTTLVFPSVWARRRGEVYKVDPSHRRQLLLGEHGKPDTPAGDRKSPLPGLLSSLTLSEKANARLWDIRDLLTEKWTIRAALHGIGSGRFKVGLDSVFGLSVAVLTISAYYVTGSSRLSNVLGTAVCYSAFSLLSPTSFPIGTMVLSGLFVYDIVMVFYTPYMITVATKLDVPIKLVFETNSRSSILGLGDIVIPGIFIALALRFDLWRHYKGQIKQVPVELKSEYAGAGPGQAVTTAQVHYAAEKAPYVDPRGHWGDRLWTATSVRGLLSAPAATPELAATAFPRAYFHATMAGYAVGMALTSAMLVVFKHGQPALLYLVPCVAGAAWLTGAVRGELGDMWTYTEDGSLDTRDVVVDVDGQGAVIKEAGEGGASGAAVSSADGQAEEREPPGSSKPSRPGADEGCHVFLFRITAPPLGRLKEE